MFKRLSVKDRAMFVEASGSEGRAGLVPADAHLIVRLLHYVEDFSLLVPDPRYLVVCTGDHLISRRLEVSGKSLTDQSHARRLGLDCCSAPVNGIICTLKLSSRLSEP